MQTQTKDLPTLFASMKTEQEALATLQENLRSLSQSCITQYDNASSKEAALKLSKDHLKSSLFKVSEQLTALTNNVLSIVDSQSDELVKSSANLKALEHKVVLRKSVIGNKFSANFRDTQKSIPSKKKTQIRTFKNASTLELQPIDFNIYDNLGHGSLTRHKSDSTHGQITPQKTSSEPSLNKPRSKKKLTIATSNSDEDVQEQVKNKARTLRSTLRTSKLTGDIPPPPVVSETTFIPPPPAIEEEDEIPEEVSTFPIRKDNSIGSLDALPSPDPDDDIDRTPEAFQIPDLVDDMPPAAFTNDPPPPSFDEDIPLPDAFDNDLPMPMDDMPPVEHDDVPAFDDDIPAFDDELPPPEDDFMMDMAPPPEPDAFDLPPPDLDDDMPPPPM